MRLVAYDSETHLIQPGLLTPPMVCASVAELGQRGRLLTKAQGLTELRRLLEDPNILLVLANAPFDFAVAAVTEPSLLRLIFAAYRANRVHDILVAQALDAIAKGTLYKEKNGSPLLSSRGTQTDRYSLDICTRLNLGRTDAKANDFWRLRYAILEGVPFDVWPEEAKQYPVDDVENTVLNGAHQLGLDRTGQVFNEKQLRAKLSKLHALYEGATTDGERNAAYEGICRVQERLESASTQGVREPFENLQDLPAQVYTDWCLHLGAVWGLRTDECRIDVLEARAQELHAEYIERFTKVGFFRSTRDEYLPGGKKEDSEDPDEGKKDTCAVARAVAEAYGATGTCPACHSTGHVRPTKATPCKGAKIKNRYQGCLGILCTVCASTGEIHKEGSEIVCKRCVGCGFEDFSTVPMTDGGKTGVKRIATDRDTLAESGDETLVEFAENKHEKALKTYVPYLRRGGDKPITLEPNVLVESGRTSYRGVIQLFPRGSLGVTSDGRWVPTARECFVARPGRVFGSTDYPAGELCALAQVCLWVVRYSRMADIINLDGKPGSLHGVFAARMTGDTPEAFLAKVEAKDKKAKIYRQTAKPCFHPDTEALTKTGWKRIGDLTLLDQVATAYPVEGESRVDLVWDYPTTLTRRRFDTLVHLKNEGIDLRVTPQHRMLTYRNRYAGVRGRKKVNGMNWTVVDAQDFGQQRGWANAGTWNGGDTAVDERLLRLAVAVQADGTYAGTYRSQRNPPIRLGLSKKRKIERLKSLLLPGEYEVKKTKNGDWQPTTSFRLSDALTTQIKNLLDPDKTFPWRWLELRPELRRVVLEEVQHWDGDRINGKAHRFYSVIKKNHDVLQAMASITGLKTRYASDMPCEGNQVCGRLTIRAKGNSRGGSVEKAVLPYDGDVVCLSVPSSFVLVRDGGVPVIVGQCNFGLPGGMGSPKFVLTNRKENAGTTEAPNGRKYPGIRFCISVGGAYECGTEKLRSWGRKAHEYEIAPTCKACLELVEHELKPLWFETFPEVRVYHNWVKNQLKAANNVVPCFGPWYPKREAPHRVRNVSGADSPFCAGANNGFQAFIADITKTALRKVTTEAYTDSDSVLYQANTKVVCFQHDELFWECDEELAHLVGERVGVIMHEAYNEWIPDVRIEGVDSALQRYWNKDAETVRDSNGKLIVWEPKTT